MRTQLGEASLSATDIDQRSRERRIELEELERQLCVPTAVSGFGEQSRFTRCGISLQRIVRAVLWWLAVVSWTVAGLVGAIYPLAE